MMHTSPPHFNVVRYTNVVSTNLLALELGEQGAAHGTVVVAEKQSGGRGRMTRDFASPAGGLYFSVILRPETDPEYISFLTIAAGVACSRIVEQYSRLSVLLKWPNDLYLGEKKLGGILTETAPYSNVDHTFPFIVVGIGLNINTRLEKFPHPLRDSITSLYYMHNQCYDLEPFMADIVQQLMHYTGNLEFLRDEICTYWQQRDYLYGKKMSWHGARDTVTCGTGAGLLPDGRYQLQKEDNILLPIAGGELRLIENE